MLGTRSHTGGRRACIMGFGRGFGEKKHYMRVAILEDYQKASPALACFAKLAGHEVTVFSEPMRDGSALVSKLNQFVR